MIGACLAQSKSYIEAKRGNLRTVQKKKKLLREPLSFLSQTPNDKINMNYIR